MILRLASAFAALAFVAACSSTVEQQATTTGGTTSTETGGQGGHGGHGGAGTGGMTTTNGTGGTGGAGLPPCEIDGQWDMPVDGFQCTLPSPCPEAHFYFGTQPGQPGPSGPHFGDPAATTCVLQKLRDREISMLSIASTPKDDFIGQNTYTEVIFVLDADHGASNAVQDADLSSKKSVKNRQILQPPAFFEACLAETDPTKIYGCLTGWSAGCADVDVPCPTK